MRIVVTTALAILLAGTLLAQKTTDLPRATFEGTVKAIDHKKMVVAEEENDMDFYFTRKTRIYDGQKEIKPAQLKTGDRVKVEATPRGDGTVDAAVIRVQHR